jgi:hypothetical protein
VAEIASVDTTYDDYTETICSIVNYSEDYSLTYCRANISVNYHHESQNLTTTSECSVPLVSGEWMEVRVSSQRGLFSTFVFSFFGECSESSFVSNFKQTEKYFILV